MQSNRMATINDLPIEIWFHILENLGFKDIVRSRAVSKMWKNRTDIYKINDLAIVPTHFVQLNLNFVFIDNSLCSNDKIERILGIDFDSREGSDLFRNTLTILNLLSNLKRLLIHTDQNAPHIYRVIANLFQFPNLEQLDLKTSLSRGQLSICHNNLKVMCVHCHLRDKLLLNTPNLERFIAVGSDFRKYLFGFRYPDKLKYLRAELWVSIDVADFRNLEYIDILINQTYIHFYALLEKLPKLTIIQIISKHYHVTSSDTFLNAMIHLFQQKDALNRIDLKIFVNRTQITSRNQIEQLVARNHML